MTIELREGIYFSRMFYADIHQGDTLRGNFFGAIYRDPESQCWSFKYRMRWYRDDDLTRNSKDERLWFEVRAKTGDAGMLLSLQERARTVLGIMARSFDEIVLDTDHVEEMRSALHGRPWSHASNNFMGDEVRGQA